MGQGSEHGAVGISGLVGHGSTDKLIPSACDTHLDAMGPFEIHPHLGRKTRAGRCERAVVGQQHFPGLGLRTLHTDGFTGSRRPDEKELVPFNAQLFHGHHRVRARGHGGAGHDAQRFTGADVEF